MSNFVVAGRKCFFLVAAALACRSTAQAGDATEGSEWLSENDAGVLELLLVHREQRSADGGVLLVDPNRRVLTWEGIPGERGCRQRLEAPFGNVRAVRDEPAGLVRLEIKGQPRDRWIFVPLPHAVWLAQPASALSGGMSKEVADSLVGPDGFPLPVGGSAVFSGAQFRTGVVPGEVSGDVRLAVERIREVLGRTPAPSVELHEALSGRPIEVSIPDLLESPGALEGRERYGCEGSSRSCPIGRASLFSRRDGGSAWRRSRSSPTSWLPSCPTGKGRRSRWRASSGAARRRRQTRPATRWSSGSTWDRRRHPPRPRSVRRRSKTWCSGRRSSPGQVVRVVGRFRGHDVDRSLPPPRPRGAWAIKAGRHAIWVTGHKPSGRGFTLHPELEADTHKWLEVVGRLEVQDGACRLRASAVGLSAPASFVGFGKRLVGALQPDVVFTLPIAEGDPVAANARFLVQFNAYMDEDSFEGRVRLRYADVPGEPGAMQHVRFTYDDVRRTLIVEPAAPLRAGATVELLLLTGIIDAFSTPLGAGPGADSSGAARVLRWRVEG